MYAVHHQDIEKEVHVEEGARMALELSGGVGLQLGNHLCKVTMLLSLLCLEDVSHACHMHADYQYPNPPVFHSCERLTS